MSKWKMQSLQFRQAMRSTKDVEDDYGATNFGGGAARAPAQTFEDPSYKQCPSCQRKFCEDAANRHIPLCAQKAKANAMKTGKGPKAAPVQNVTQSKFPKQSTSQIGFGAATGQSQLSGTQRGGFKKGIY